MKYTSLKIDSQLLLMDKTNEISHEISSFLSDLSIEPTSIVKVDCYVPVNIHDEYSTCSSTFNSVLSEIFKEKMPAKLFVAQQLADDAQSTLFKFSICDDKAVSIEYKEFQKHPYCLIKNNEEKIVLSGGITFEQSGDTLRLVQSTFDFMEQLLDHEEMHFGHVATQVNYINDIQGTNKDATTGWTNMQTIEEIRSLYFDPNLFKHGYPLQNNINLMTAGFVIDFIASSKEGFPTAQYNINKEVEQTLNCFIPGLKKLFIKATCGAKESSCEKQLQLSLNTLKETIDNCNKEINEVVDEIKVTISNRENFELVNQIISKQVKTNKLVIFHSPLKTNDLKVEFEAITSVIC